MGTTKGNGGDIDAHLKRAFDQLQNDPLPDKLLGLLDQLRNQDTDVADTTDSVTGQTDTGNGTEASSGRSA